MGKEWIDQVRAHLPTNAPVVLHLSARDQAALVEALLDPPAPTPALVAAMRRKDLEAL